MTLEGCETIVCGFWINWSKGTILGWTLTLPNQYGLVVVAFVTLSIKFAGGTLWGIIRYLYHQINASSRLQDDIYHQLQVVLRNEESEPRLILNLFKLCYGHKKNRFSAYRRALPLIFVAIAHMFGIWIAGLVTPTVLVVSDDVRLANQSCGFLEELSQYNNFTEPKDFETANALLVTVRSAHRRAASYTQICYNNGYGKNSSVCNMLARPTIHMTSKSVPCPFQEKICNGTALELDTGFFHSDVHLGINTRPKDRISVRKVLTCVPLAGEKFTRGWFNMSEEQTVELSGSPIANFIAYKFGRRRDPVTQPDLTFIIDSLASARGETPYRLNYLSSTFKSNSTELEFDPIPELLSRNTDVTVISIVNRMRYRTAVQDPWFNSNVCTRDALLGSFCMSTNPMSFLGCQERYQLCNHNFGYCSPLTGIWGITPDSNNLTTFNPMQKTVFNFMSYAIRGVRLFNQIGFVSQENFNANRYLWGEGTLWSVSATLPDTQWQTEVANWMNTSLAGMQLMGQWYARPPDFNTGTGIDLLNHVVPPQDMEHRLLCEKVKVRSQAHTSFSALGLSLTVAVVLLLVVTDLSLPKIVGYVQFRTGKGLHRRLDWTETGTFQLQRVAAEGRGIGPWNGREKEVPTLVEIGRLFSLTGLSLKSQAHSYERQGKGLNEMEIENRLKTGKGRPRNTSPRVEDEEYRDHGEVEDIEEVVGLVSGAEERM